MKILTNLNKITLGGSTKLFSQTSDSITSLGKGAKLLVKPFTAAKEMWNKNAKPYAEAKAIKDKLREIGITEDQIQEFIWISTMLDLKILIAGEKKVWKYSDDKGKTTTAAIYPIVQALFELAIARAGRNPSNKTGLWILGCQIQEQLKQLEEKLNEKNKRDWKAKASDFVGLDKRDYVLLGKSALAITLAVCIIKESFSGKDFAKSFMTQLTGSSAGKKAAEYLSSGIKSLGKAGGFLESVAAFAMRNKNSISKFVILFSALKLIKLADKSLEKRNPLDKSINSLCEDIGRKIIQYQAPAKKL